MIVTVGGGLFLAAAAVLARVIGPWCCRGAGGACGAFEAGGTAGVGVCFVAGGGTAEGQKLQPGVGDGGRAGLPGRTSVMVGVVFGGCVTRSGRDLSSGRDPEFSKKSSGVWKCCSDTWMGCWTSGMGPVNGLTLSMDAVTATGRVVQPPVDSNRNTTGET